MPERYLEPNDSVVRMFAALAVDQVGELPIESLTPTIVDDMTQSRTPGPIEAYALACVDASSQRLGRIVIWIADGNHRYFEHVREGHAMIAVRKIVPDPDHDIRVMFNAADRWEDV